MWFLFHYFTVTLEICAHMPVCPLRNYKENSETEAGSVCDVLMYIRFT